MKRLIAYGCSWTVGEGCDLKIEKKLKDKELKNFRNENSWSFYLANKLNINEVINNGISGNSNIKIFNQVISDVENNLVNSDDFICVMFSSSLRDVLPYFPNNEWISWSVKHLIESPDRFVNSYFGKSKKFNKFLSIYKKFFLTKLFNQDYYNIVNQNYIIFLQNLFNYYNIKYVMIESFENLVKPPLKNDFTEHIDCQKIYGLLELTMKDFLISLNRNDIWESEFIDGTQSNSHPNKLGYEILSDEIYKFIIKNNILYGSR